MRDWRIGAVVLVVLACCSDGGARSSAEGESCAATSDCEQPLRCLDQVCTAVALGSDGDPCTGDTCTMCASDAVVSSTTLVKTASMPRLGDVLQGAMIDLNEDGVLDEADFVDADGDGLPDDYDQNGLPDNRFYFDDRSSWVPDADSFDDYEDPDFGIPRAVTPVSAECDADGIETGPLELGFADYRPSSYCLHVATVNGRPCVPEQRPESSFVSP